MYKIVKEDEILCLKVPWKIESSKLLWGIYCHRHGSDDYNWSRTWNINGAAVNQRGKLQWKPPPSPPSFNCHPSHGHRVPEPFSALLSLDHRKLFYCGGNSCFLLCLEASDCIKRQIFPFTNDHVRDYCCQGRRHMWSLTFRALQNQKQNYRNSCPCWDLFINSVLEYNWYVIHCV